MIPAGFAGKINLTVPATTLLDLADRPGELAGIGPVDPDLARDLAAAAAANPKTTWCVTVTDAGRARHRARLRPARTPERPGQTRQTGTPGGPDPPGSTSGSRFTFTPDRRDGPPGGWGTWRLATGMPGRPDLIIRLGPIATDPCDHRYQARGHDPGVLLRHLTQIRYATCTGPGCRRPAAQADFEHSVPYEAGGRTCTCNGDPKCRHDHRLKQHPGWTAEHLADGTDPVDDAQRTAVQHRTYQVPRVGRSPVDLDARRVQIGAVPDGLNRHGLTRNGSGCEDSCPPICCGVAAGPNRDEPFQP